MDTESSSAPTVAPQTAAPDEDILPEGYTVDGGHLHLHGIDLAALAEYWLSRAGLDDAPLTIRYMPSVRLKLQAARDAFARASSRTGYSGQVRMAYASKANPYRPVIQAAASAGADYE